MSGEPTAQLRRQKETSQVPPRQPRSNDAGHAAQRERLRGRDPLVARVAHTARRRASLPHSGESTKIARNGVVAAVPAAPAAEERGQVPRRLHRASSEAEVPGSCPRRPPHGKTIPRHLLFSKRACRSGCAPGRRGAGRLLAASARTLGASPNAFHVIAPTTRATVREH